MSEADRQDIDPTASGTAAGREGDHVGCFVRGDASAGRAAARFVEGGLASGARVLWIGDGRPVEGIQAMLASHGVDVRRHHTDGRLQFRKARECLCRDGRLDPEYALANLMDEIARTAQDGLESVRVVQEMPPVDGATADPEALRAYEAGLDALLSRHPLDVLCLYDPDALPDPQLLDAVQEHPLVVEDGEMVGNVFYWPSGDVKGWDRSQRTRQRKRRFEEIRRGRRAIRRLEVLLRLLGATRAAAQRARSRDDALAAVLDEVCRAVGWPLGHVYLMDPDTRRLEPSLVWYRESPDRFGSLVQTTRGLALDRGEGLPGRVLDTGRAAWVTDVAGDPEAGRLRGVREDEIRTALAIPIRLEDEIQGVVELFAPDLHDPDPDLIHVLEEIGAELGEVLARKRMEEELVRGRERFQALVESSSDAIVVADHRSRIVSWNRAATEMFGYTAEEILGELIQTLMPDRYQDAHAEAFSRAVDTGAPPLPGRTLEVHGRAKNGREFPLELSLATWISDGRRYFSGILRDLSAHTEAEEELALLGSAVANVHDAILITTVGDSGRGPTILYVNPAFTEMTGFSEAEVLGRSFGILTGAKSDPSALRELQQAMKVGEPAALEITAYRRDGTEFLLDWRASPIREPHGDVRHYVSIQRDITEERVAEETLRRADRDPLTGLPNRQTLVKRLRRAIERATDRPDYRYALLFLDLDAFKRVNDTHGHIAGDQLLTSAARRLERTVRPGDTIARFGGDEFVILLEYVSGVADVLTVSERIQSHMGIPFVLQGHEYTASASIGIALSDSGYAAAEDVIRDADEAMYRAKQRGKGRSEVFDSELYDEVVNLFRLQSELSRAVERGELEVYYQPVVSLKTGAITGVEALLRWDHPERGLMLPEHFIPLAEESGLIVPIGRWALREACRGMRVWDRALNPAEPLRLSVNLSAREITRPDLVEAVRDTLEETGFDPSRLQLEITESVFIDRPDAARERLDALRALGVQVCIDDFGTGYSSLGYLHRFPIELLKIDRLFVRGMESSTGAAGGIVRTILDLARSLGMQVLAEGVETREQAASLRSMDCELAQGFYFSEPVRTDQVERLAARFPLAELPTGLSRWH